MSDHVEVEFGSNIQGMSPKALKIDDQWIPLSQIDHIRTLNHGDFETDTFNELKMLVDRRIGDGVDAVSISMAKWLADKNEYVYEGLGD